MKRTSIEYKLERKGEENKSEKQKSASFVAFSTNEKVRTEFPVNHKYFFA